MKAIARLFSSLLLAGTLIGCASTPSPQYQTAVAERPLPAGPGVSVGESTAAQGVGNTTVTLRGATRGSSAAAGSFSGYLREALIAELSASGRYDADAGKEISLELLRHDVSAAGVKEGYADLAVRVTVREGTTELLADTYESRHTWPSSFIGAVAIPAAFDNYPTAVQKLLGVVMADPAFHAAIE